MFKPSICLPVGGPHPLVDTPLCVPLCEGGGSPSEVGSHKLAFNSITDATWVPGRDGWALRFTAGSTNQGLKFADPEALFDLNFSTGEIYIFARFHVESLATPLTIVSNDTENTSGWGLHIHTDGAGYYKFHGSGTADFSVMGGAGSFVVGSWYDVAFTLYDNSGPTGAMYINEDDAFKKLSVGSAGTTPATSTSDICLGNRSQGGTDKNGAFTLSDLRIHRGHMGFSYYVYQVMAGFE